MDEIAKTPDAPYYAVIFSSLRTAVDDGYAQMAQRMKDLVSKQPGFLGVETVRAENFGVTVSYWRDEESIRSWKADIEHRDAQRLGKSK